MNLYNLFPLKGEITQEIINKANVKNPYACIGALTLKAALDKAGVNSNVSWAHHSSYSTTIEGQSLGIITTEQGINMVKVTTPQEVTFIMPIEYLNT